MKLAPIGALLAAAGCVTSEVRAPLPPLPSGPVALRASDLGGRPITLGALRGKVVLVTVMATWADTALLEVDRFRALYQQYPRERLEIVYLALDELPLAVEVYAQSLELPFVVGLPDDPRALIGPDGPFGPITILPTSVLLAPSGEIAVRSDGLWPPEALEEAIRRLLAEDPPSG
jgi:hypothetical protein